MVLTNHASGPASLGYYKIIQHNGSIQGAGINTLAMPPTVNNISYIRSTSHDPGFVDVHRGLLGDANDDGVVNFADFALLSTNFGWDFNSASQPAPEISAGTSQPATVLGVPPEPASLLLLAVGMLGLLGAVGTRSR